MFYHPCGGLLSCPCMEVELIEGAHPRSPRATGGSCPGEPSSRGWWFSNPSEGTFSALEESESCSGLEESLEAVASAFVERGPFSGMMGFSQGAALVGILCALCQQGDPRFPFRFALLVSGFQSKAKPHHVYYDAPIAVPSIHIFGENDQVIPAAMSRELAARFEGPRTLLHPGGHFVPAAGPQRKEYVAFLDQFGHAEGDDGTST
ncbi:esterase OVCA2 isoform X2 [Anolis carolinensis]|uniref:esterase OVCA2 isoform X2 n=1 Tax=Anolis carolinensis TaxID=28377 RepID=UPI002F2B8EE1